MRIGVEVCSLVPDGPWVQNRSRTVCTGDVELGDEQLLSLRVYVAGSPDPVAVVPFSMTERWGRIWPAVVDELEDDERQGDELEHVTLGEN